MISRYVNDTAGVRAMINKTGRILAPARTADQPHLISCNGTARTVSRREGCRVKGLALRYPTMRRYSRSITGFNPAQTPLKVIIDRFRLVAKFGKSLRNLTVAPIVGGEPDAHSRGK